MRRANAYVLDKMNSSTRTERLRDIRVEGRSIVHLVTMNARRKRDGRMRERNGGLLATSNGEME